MRKVNSVEYKNQSIPTPRKLPHSSPRRSIHPLSKSPKMEELESQSEPDRISQLPDPILQHILSFINIKQAVHTTILSQRWRNLWRSISDLDFTFSRLTPASESLQHFTHRFSDFVSHFLSHRDCASTIRQFRLSLDSRHVHVDAQFVEKCVDHAIRHGVVSLHLHALCRPALRFSDGCKTLRELTLKQFGYGVRLPKELSLPNLNTLYLENSNFIEDGDFFAFLKEPFSRFPALEKLTLRRCTVYGIVISAPKLRALEIIQDKLFSEVMGEITTPMLTSFRYEGYFPLECSSVNTPSLVQVYFNIYTKKMGLQHKRLPWKCVDMMQKFGNAKFVTLSLDTIKVLEMDGHVFEPSPSPFPKIEHLKLRKGRREISRVSEGVVDYLTKGSLCGVEIPEGVFVVEKNSDEESGVELQMGDETQFQLQNFGAFQELLMPKFRQDGAVIF